MRWSRPLKVIVIEGSLRWYDYLLSSALQLVRELRQDLHHEVTLEVIGDVPEYFIREHSAWSWIRWAGRIPNEAIPDRLRGAHLFVSAVLNPACPNAVLEAMACGVPVVGYDTGALRELVGDTGGKTVPYGADPWRLEPPANSELLRDAAILLLKRGSDASRSARERAKAFSEDTMVTKYMKVLFG
jgi:glycosyltransferase involved in cell wall biosynthesis